MKLKVSEKNSYKKLWSVAQLSKRGMRLSLAETGLPVNINAWRFQSVVQYLLAKSRGVKHI